MIYVTEAFIRDRARDSLTLKAGAVSPSERSRHEAWIETLIEKARREHHLLTEQQYSDWVMQRRFAPGDRCKYIGPSRLEPVNGKLYPRDHGQLGAVVRIEAKPDGNVIVFMPNKAVPPETQEGEEPGEALFVFLFVKENTPGWLELERIP